MSKIFASPTRATASALVVAFAGFGLAACGSSSHNGTTGSNGSNPPSSTPSVNVNTSPNTTTTAAPPVVAGTGIASFCQQAKNLISFNAGTGQQAQIKEAMPAIDNLVKIAPAQIKTQVSAIAAIFQTVASGGKLTAQNVPKTLQKDISDYKTFVQANCK
jgi:hypothetical protein